MFIGDGECHLLSKSRDLDGHVFFLLVSPGAKLVRDAFDLAKEKIKEGNRKGAIIFIDELDSIGSTLLSLLNNTAKP